MSPGRTKRPGWWRRNLFGLLLLLPALVLAMVEPAIVEYDALWGNRERLPVRAADGAWVTYAGVRVRLIEISEEKELPSRYGTPRPVPSGMRVVRVVLAFDGPGAALNNCAVTMLSTAGDEYDARPDELSSMSLGLYPCSFTDAIEPTPSTTAGPSTSASPSTEATGLTQSTAATSSPTPSVDPSASHQWRTETYFVMPLTAYPASVKLSLFSELPTYLILS